MRVIGSWVLGSGFGQHRVAAGSWDVNPIPPAVRRLELSDGAVQLGGAVTPELVRATIASVRGAG
jgi:hypothetical protein